MPRLLILEMVMMVLIYVLEEETIALLILIVVQVFIVGAIHVFIMGQLVLEGFVLTV